jgi:hypothetical protein
MIKSTLPSLIAMGFLAFPLTTQAEQNFYFTLGAGINQIQDGEITSQGGLDFSTHATGKIGLGLFVTPNFGFETYFSPSLPQSNPERLLRMPYVKVDITTHAYNAALLGVVRIPDRLMNRFRLVMKIGPSCTSLSRTIDIDNDALNIDESFHIVSYSPAFTYAIGVEWDLSKRVFFNVGYEGTTVFIENLQTVDFFSEPPRQQLNGYMFNLHWIF